MSGMHPRHAPGEVSSFSQYRISVTKTPEARQLTWVCGTEAILIEDVVQTVKKNLAPEPWNYVTLVVGEDTERKVWSEVNQHPIGASARLVVIRGAEKLQRMDQLTDFLKHRATNPRTHLLFVSSEARIRRLEPTEEERRNNGKGEIVPFLKVGVRGHVIECRPYTADTAKHAVTWVQSKVKMRDGVAGHLLNRANGDLRLVRDVCDKLAVFPEEPNLSTINEILSARPRDTFADALLALDRKTALLALERLPTSEYSRVVGLLDFRLDLAGMVHDLLLEHKTPSEIARASGTRGFLVPDLLPVAKHYDAKRRLSIRKMLALADQTLRGGESTGVMEALVTTW